jgi:hypothetical protein
MAEDILHRHKHLHVAYSKKLIVNRDTMLRQILVMIIILRKI